MKILVTGAHGQLGYDVCRCLSARRIEHRGVDLSDFDITDRDAVQQYFDSYSPTAVIHCAAFTAVDRAEIESALCTRINLNGTQNLAESAAAIGASVMYLSTDYVFDGREERPKETGDRTNPLSVYGKTKRMGELAVIAATNQHFIVRTSWVFGVHGKNFVKTVLRLSDERDEIRVVSDQIGSPTYTRDLAQLLCDMIQTERFGVYHATGSGFCSWAEFAEEILRQSQKQTKVCAIASSEYPTAAIRPHNSRLSAASLTENGFTPLPHWKDALTRYLDEERTCKRRQDL